MPIVLLNTDGIVLLTNTNWSERINLSPDECVGLTIFELIPRSAELNKRRIKEIVETGQRRIYEDCIPLTTGSLWYSSNFQPGKRRGWKNRSDTDSYY